jgi:glycerophosphoryl diester phosphodiesterase
MSRKAPRLKWHMVRRRRDDPAFLRRNLVAGLDSGAALEVDLVLTADGHFVCLHDLTLDAETTGAGPVAAAIRADLIRLRQRGPDGAVLDDPPLFLDEVVATIARHGHPDGGLVQLDMKDPPERLDDAAIARLRDVLGSDAGRFIAGSTDGHFLDRLRVALPGLTRGFDPLALYGFGAAIPGDRVGFETIADEMVRLAPDAAIFYLEADLILAGLASGVDLVARAHRTGAEVDAWTIDTTRPAVRNVLRTLLGLGVDQITTNEPDRLGPLIEDIA